MIARLRYKGDGPYGQDVAAPNEQILHRAGVARTDLDDGLRLHRKIEAGELGGRRERRGRAKRVLLLALFTRLTMRLTCASCSPKYSPTSFKVQPPLV
jgi:hypothetical protein